MATTIDAATITFEWLTRIKGALDLSTPQDELLKRINFTFTDGTGANKAKNHWHDQRQIAASGTDSLDLAGVLTNALGDVLTFTKIKAILIYALSTNTNNVEVGGGATVFPLFKDASDILPIHPGGLFVITAPDANGIAVGVGATDLLQIKNSAGGSVVDYIIAILGEV
jgi:hypothetical protein